MRHCLETHSSLNVECWEHLFAYLTVESNMNFSQQSSPRWELDCKICYSRALLNCDHGLCCLEFIPAGVCLFITVKMFIGDSLTTGVAFELR